MSSNVIKFKGSGVGLWLVPDKAVSYDEIEKALRETLKQNVHKFPEGMVLRIAAGGFGVEDRKALEGLLAEFGIKALFKEEMPKVLHSGVDALVKGNSASSSKNRQRANNFDTAVEEMTVVNRTVRGGEEIISKSSILICGNVNPGAQIVAGGSIDIRGTCRGFVHAGANGDETAFIIADHLMPTQIRIAGLIARSPDVMEKTDHAERAIIRDGQIVIEPMER